MKCGYIAIIGRPNVGKSTLINCLIGAKISITSRKPQTTRHQILGVLTEKETQFIFVDTPGMHQEYQDNLMNRQLNRFAFSSLKEVDLVLWLIEPKWGEQEAWLFKRLSTVTVPIVLAINKADLLKDKNELLPLMQKLKAMEKFAEIIPVSARHRSNIAELLAILSKYLKEKEFIFARDDMTDKSVKFLTSEIIREKLMRFLGDELPYQTAVAIEKFEETAKLVEIDAVIYVERPTQKAIVIGKQGEKLKEIGKEARYDIEKLLSMRVMLRLWVKVEENWRQNQRILKEVLHL